MPRRPNPQARLSLLEGGIRNELRKPEAERRHDLLALWKVRREEVLKEIAATKGPF